LRYICGPHDAHLLESFLSDIWAGITVALTLIPQGLSYAGLANLPAVNGLYAAVLPSASYTFFGSAMQLAVGPVAIVSLLVGTLVNQYVPNYATDTQAAIDTAAQASLCCGIILTIMAVFNMGDFINFLAQPVMSGFTSAAACLIGLNQLKNAFGYTVAVPQAGQEHYEYNYQVMQWWADNWNLHTYPNTCKTTTTNGVKTTKCTASANNGRWQRNHYAVAVS
jgi:SulP family sulfate permease